jgi:ketopantoate reductase
MSQILILGASYGSLLAAKLLLAGHSVRLVCLPAEADLINRDGFRVRLPVKGRDGLVEVDSRRLPGRATASGTAGVEPGDYDLVALAMQEPQYGAAGVRELLQAIAVARVPCMSIMNMPPLTYLARIPALQSGARLDSRPDGTRAR